MKKTKAPKSKKPARAAKPAAAKKEIAPRPDRIRDPRIPPVGTKLTRVYKGKTIEVAIKEDGFWHDGGRFNSLSALATKLADGTPKNGILWFGLSKRAAPKRTPDDAAHAETAKDETPAAEKPAKRAAKGARKTRRAGRDPAAVDAPAADQGVDTPTPETV